jgi:hypothetical protein
MGLLAALLLIISCFLPWVIVESPSLTISGVDATGTTYGKPGYLNLILTVFFLVLTFTPKVWAKRLNLFIVAINIAWAIRNYLILNKCYAGECPLNQPGIFLMLAASLMMLVSALFPDIKLPIEKNKI